MSVIADMMMFYIYSIYAAALIQSDLHFIYLLLLFFFTTEQLRVLGGPAI